MKKFFTTRVLSIVLCCGSAVNLVAQHVSITNAGPSSEASALLEVKSIDKGILLPRMTASQRSTIANPFKGLLVFQTDGTPGFYYYDGRVWRGLSDGNIVNNEGVSESYSLVTVFAGTVQGYANGFNSKPRFNGPRGITADRVGNIYVADSGNYSIRKITPLGVVTTLAGSTTSGYANGTGKNAAFNFPGGVAIDPSGNLYVIDTDNRRIRKISPGAVVTTFAGSGVTTGFEDGVGTAAGFNFPLGIAADTAGNIYVADTYNHKIRKITPGALVTTLAGNGSAGSANGTGVAASFARPVGLTLDAAGNIYVADMDNHSIRKITAAGVVTSFAGTGMPGAADGSLASATFNSPKAIAIDAEGNFYIADAGNHKIRKITPDGMVSTLAGNNSAGNAEGEGTAAYFNDPSGLTIDASGILYVSDSGNHLISKIIIR